MNKDVKRIKQIQPDIDTSYKTVDGVRLPVKMYLNNASDVMVLTIHGGAWYAIKEDADKWSGSWMNFQAQYYAERGFNAAAISYRSIDFNEETTVFDLINDCRDAVEFIKSKSDFKKLIIMGDSAGGHLALSLADMADTVIAANPVTDCTTWENTAKTDEDRKKASPLHNIAKTNAKILFMHGDADQVVDCKLTEKMCNEMKAVGNECEFIKIPNEVHAFILQGYKSTDEKVMEYMEAINEYLERNGYEIKKIWNGFEKLEFEFEGRNAILVLPKKKEPNGNWTLKTEYWDAFPETEIELLNRGFHAAWLQNTSRFATKEDCAAKARFVKFISEKYGLRDKCVPVGMSCGGAHAVNFAGFHPESVACMFIDAPVLNFFDFPARYDKFESVWENEFIKAYPGMTRAKLMTLEEQPMNRIDSLIENQIPIIMLYGTEDTTVDYNMNGRIFAESYTGHEDLLKIVPRSLQGHHPHGLMENSDKLADWIIERL